VIGFEETAYSGVETAGAIRVVVALRQGELSGPVVVRITTMDGTAIAGSDYRTIDQLLTFNQSSTRIPVDIPILEDDVDELDEDILASLTLQDGGEQTIQIAPEMSTVTIIDDGSEF
jgi:solute carrier family 8 (sodium/calcium exchanger)